MNSDTIKISFDQEMRRGIFAPVARHVHADVEDRKQDALGRTFPECALTDAVACASRA